MGRFETGSLVLLFDPSVKRFPVPPGQKDHQQANAYQYGKENIIPFEKEGALGAEHKCSGHPPDAGKENKYFNRQCTESKKKTK